MPAFEEYVLVAQSEPMVEAFRRQPDGRWLLATYSGMNSAVEIAVLECNILLSEIYEGITFAE